MPFAVSTLMLANQINLNTALFSVRSTEGAYNNLFCDNRNIRPYGQNALQLTQRYANELPQFGSKVTPQSGPDVRLCMVNTAHAQALSIAPQMWQSHTLQQALFSDTGILGQHAIAQKYGGHQFGHWNPQLGDGRGLLLSEVKHANGHSVDLHLKGAGKTPYSRGGDGRAVLRSTLREYIGSEALHHLGIPSSRSLCLLTTGETILRERPEPGAMMIRTAPSHLRFGHFEYYFYHGDQTSLDDLINFTLRHHFPHCLEAQQPIGQFLQEVIVQTAHLMAKWQAYGFVHGVMNTDNMSVHGITFDYGPYAFIEQFNASAVFNHSDTESRYAFDRQPGIGLWNLNAFAHSLSSYLSKEQLHAALARFEPEFIHHFQQIMTARLGLPNGERGSLDVLHQWLTMLEQQRLDYHIPFRKLAELEDCSSACPLRDEFIDRDAFDQWWPAYQIMRSQSGPWHKIQAQMLRLNPVVVARTHHLQTAIEHAELGDFSVANDLIAALSTPFARTPLTERFSRPAKTPTHSVLSCSS